MRLLGSIFALLLCQILVQGKPFKSIHTLYYGAFVLIKVIACLLDSTCQDSPNCSPTATQFDDYMCYQIGDAVVDYVNAGCPTLLGNSKLVSIKFEAEQNHLVVQAGGVPFWTSAKRDGPSINFKWEDNTNVADGYFNWADGQPGDDPENNCLIVADDGKWRAVPCSGAYVPMCQSPLQWENSQLQAVLISVRHSLRGNFFCTYFFQLALL